MTIPTINHHDKHSESLQLVEQVVLGLTTFYGTDENSNLRV